MKLVIGGYAQGKLQMVLRSIKNPNPVVFDGQLPGGEKRQETEKHQDVIINHFHLWVKERLLQNGNPEKEMLSYLAENKNCIIISDEIGNGIIPMDAFEREYREQTGRILVQLAEQADEVVRVICGIGQKIK